MRVLLGNYRIRQTHRRVTLAEAVTLSSGLFAGWKLQFPKRLMGSDRAPRVALPPLARHSTTVIDFTPFLIFEHILLDRSAYETSVAAHNPLPGVNIPTSTKKLLKALAGTDFVDVIDIEAQLEQTAPSQEIQAMTVHDLQDSNIETALHDSLLLWIALMRDTMNRSTSELAPFYNYLQMLDSRQPTKELFHILLHCTLDINQTLVASKLLNASVYDYEDYRAYHAYKLGRGGHRDKSHGPASWFQKAMEVFVPDYSPTSLEEILEIRSHPYIESVRTLFTQHRLKDPNSELVEAVRRDLDAIKAKHAKYLKVFEWATLAGAPIPFLGPALELVKEGASHRKWKDLTRGQEWKLFFLDMRHTFGRQEADQWLDA